jgi:S-adenosylmethionine decarboxylase
MLPRGTHLLVEYLGCQPAQLNDPALLEHALREAAALIGARVVTAAFHQFSPHGVTGMLLLEESHLSIHTWPEHGYAAVDLYTCGTPAAERAVPALATALKAQRSELLTVARGQLASPRALTVLG